MKNSGELNRRSFLQSSLAGSAALAALAVPFTTGAALTKERKEADAGLKLGLTSYTLRKYKLDEALALTKEAGVKYISLKDMHLPLKSTKAQCEEARQKVEAAGLTLMGGGVIYMKNNPAELRGFFDYAKNAGMPALICSPDPDALDAVEKLAKEYDVRIAIHNHGPTDKKYPSPLDVLKLIKDRDAHMGLCIDVGHTVRIGQDPIPIIETCADRLYDFHIKDVTLAEPNGKAITVGRGVIDIVAVLRTLAKIHYKYQVALEYEDKGDAPVPGMFESFGYIRGVLATL